ncbi:MAG: VWA domain-containing protein, partial [Methylococcales bacterium]|nr:VWA domain-containing protein [Methylococcales bacterium]
AHNGVTDVVNNLIPEGTVVALRGFGHIEGNLACRTALEYPAQALDRDSFLAASNRIEPKFNANTPIAESLLGVQSDLADIPGPKIIILLTDGNETCGGDVAGAIEALVSGGFDVRIDVVGIGIDDDALRSEFEGWAEAGGGVYYDAPDSDSITTAMADIFSRGLPTPFQVLDSDGTLVQQGLANGDPISLPVGDSTVQVLTSPLESFDITVTEGEETAISVE